MSNPPVPATAALREAQHVLDRLAMHLADFAVELAEGAATLGRALVATEAAAGVAPAPILGEGGTVTVLPSAAESGADDPGARRCEVVTLPPARFTLKKPT